jgi:plastocyanin
MRRLFLCVLLAAGLAPAARAAGKVHVITIQAMQFAPASLDVNVGDTVVWKNTDPFPHTATAEGKGFDSRAIAPGKSWKFVVRKRGTFAYLCTLHTTMRGALTVR